MTNSYSDSNKLLRVNFLTQDMYEDLLGQDLIQDDEIYFTEENSINGNGNRIINVGTPFLNNDGATKGYVDALQNNHNVSPDAHQTILSQFQLLSNLTTTINGSSTNTQYPSARAVYNMIGDVGSILDNINGEVI